MSRDTEGTRRAPGMRWALARVAFAVTSMVALAFLVPLGVAMEHLAAQNARNQAESKITALEPLLAVTTDKSDLRDALATLSGGDDVGIRLSDQTLLGTNHANPAQLAAVAQSGRATTLAVPGGQELVQPELVGSGTNLIEVYLPDSASTHDLAEAWLTLSGVAVVLVLGSTLVADRLATRVVGSARHLADASQQLGEGDTSVRVEPHGPRELAEAGDAFNAMADRVEQLITAEREMVADLSHRLRTPLTALRLNAAGLGEGQAARQTQESVMRLELEVDKIIRTARAGTQSRATTPITSAVCEVSAVARERIAFWSALAEDQERPWRFFGPVLGAGDASPGPAMVAISAQELGAALDTLLGNIFRHTPEGTGFQVTVHHGDGAVAVLIDDAGPGLSEPRNAVKRGAGTGGTGSTGLGLDIVRKLAERVGGSLNTDRSPLGGLQVHVTLPTLEPRSASTQQRTASPWASRVPRARRADRGAASR
ncbi:HAMP domain-containing histidine kinase [Actinospica sp. MGRD01-02]|uniref:Signal transduction histidine-protein kinase/phosphatase MprB n=1 Tax=Actinospica acidithermotolerans TaxID=2828514 RepID=A0A941E7M9_9ACTN|nr:HAMP domain-containing sensor histidine kinase [Actinospica acidithermotolerans]MBR7825307.1 HAMP domain-containing histidine kinase [Actinospica acidithermotolerans]